VHLYKYFLSDKTLNIPLVYGSLMIIGVCSAKGGTGKTSFAINLGTVLALKGHKSLLVDCAMSTPDIATYLGIVAYIRNLEDIVVDINKVNSAIYMHKSGLNVITGNLHMDAKKEVSSEKLAKVVNSLEKDYDVILLDIAAGLDKDVTNSLVICDSLFIVTNPERLAVVNAAKILRVAEELRVKDTYLVLNRIGRFRGELTRSEVRDIIGKDVNIIGEIPEDDAIPISAKNSESVVLFKPKSKASKEFNRIAGVLVGEEVRQGFLAKLFG